MAVAVLGLGAFPVVFGCFGFGVSIAPTINTANQVGVEARLSAELDLLAVHAGGGGGGGWVNGQAASAWQVGGGGSIPLPRRDDGKNWIDIDLHYSGYFLHAVQSVTPEESPYAHGLRLGTRYRRRLLEFSGENVLSFGVGFFGEASHREGQWIGIFGLPIGVHVLAVPKIKKYF